MPKTRPFRLSCSPELSSAVFAVAAGAAVIVAACGDASEENRSAEQAASLAAGDQPASIGRGWTDWNLEEGTPGWVAAHASARSIDADPALRQAVDAAPVVTVYKNPTCGCCQLWIRHMELAGFEVEAVDRSLSLVERGQYGLTRQTASCHTALIGEHAFEGHIPPTVIAQFLADPPDAAGLAVPGMPAGSPGMESPDGSVRPYDVLLLDGKGGFGAFTTIR
ncbi:MAG: hypothetical protein J4G03_04445 [Gemmatimonadetes bacterium]|nr:hypothetical protein [Gemmatimonadota bacterium]